VYDCAGICDGAAVVDNCGVCNGDATSCEILGDLNGDGIINIIDIIDVVNIILNEGEYNILADVNEDGMINIVDVIDIVNWILSATTEEDVCEDYDGNIYETVEIGDQVWMAENLKVTHYRDGTLIPTGYSYPEWADLETGAYAGVDGQESENYADTYGYLYNWYAVDTGNLAPEGWHVPTDEEWMELEMTLGMSESEAQDIGDRGTNQGSQLAGNADLWWWDNELEYNEAFGISGFNAIPSGFRLSSGSFSNLGHHCYLWSSTVEDWGGHSPWCRKLHYDSSGVDRASAGKNNGYSVRCVKD
jgi:uncharacterized protein (TIGR02145 family)